MALTVIKKCFTSLLILQTKNENLKNFLTKITNQSNMQTNSKTCSFCYESGHFIAECQTLKNLVCPICKETGHTKKRCPQFDKSKIQTKIQAKLHPIVKTCSFCSETGHHIAECQTLKDFVCPICKETGHTKKRCPQFDAKYTDKFECGFCRSQNLPFSGHTKRTCSVLKKTECELCHEFGHMAKVCNIVTLQPHHPIVPKIKELAQHHQQPYDETAKFPSLPTFVSHRMPEKQIWVPVSEKAEEAEEAVVDTNLEEDEKVPAVVDAWDE